MTTRQTNLTDKDDCRRCGADRRALAAINALWAPGAFSKILPPRWRSAHVEEFGGLASHAPYPALVASPSAGGQADLQVHQTHSPRARRAAFSPIEPRGGVGKGERPWRSLREGRATLEEPQGRASEPWRSLREGRATPGGASGKGERPLEEPQGRASDPWRSLREGRAT
eukprot:gene17530-biopygen14412